jgi:hypothetical protein
MMPFTSNQVSLIDYAKSKIRLGSDDKTEIRREGRLSAHLSIPSALSEFQIQCQDLTGN